MDRGLLTNTVQTNAKYLLGRSISQAELRLMPYFQYVLMGDQQLDLRKINCDDEKVMTLWRRERYLLGDGTNIRVTKKFWDILNKLMWLAYVEAQYEEKREKQ